MTSDGVLENKTQQDEVILSWTIKPKMQLTDTSLTIAQLIVVTETSLMYHQVAPLRLT